MNRQQFGGALLFLGALQSILLVAVMEAMIPGYSVSANYISDLGTYSATAYILAATLAIQGVCYLAGAILAKKTLEKNPRDVFNLIRSCLLNGEKQEFLDEFLEIHSLTDCELITSVVDAEVVRGTLRSIYSYLRSEELEKQLPDAYEERLASQFERCCRNFEKNKAAYESGDSTIY